MRRFIFLLSVILLLAPTIAIANSANNLELNQSGILSVNQVQEFTKTLNRQFIVSGLAVMFFLILSVGPIIGFWALRTQKDFWFKFGLSVMLVIFFNLSAIAGILSFKYYLNKQIVKNNPAVSFASGELEKFVVKGGKYGETRKDIFKIDGEKYDILADDLLAGLANGDSLRVYYIELFDTGAFGLNKKKKMIVNYQADYGE